MQSRQERQEKRHEEEAEPRGVQIRPLVMQEALA